MLRGTRGTASALLQSRVCAPAMCDVSAGRAPWLPGNGCRDSHRSTPNCAVLPGPVRAP